MNDVSDAAQVDECEPLERGGVANHDREDIAHALAVWRILFGHKEPRQQGLTLVHFPAQFEPCLTHKNTLHTLSTPLTWATQPLRAPPIP